jgi:hypothetical protein
MFPRRVWVVLASVSRIAAALRGRLNGLPENDNLFLVYYQQIWRLDLSAGKPSVGNFVTFRDIFYIIYLRIIQDKVVLGHVRKKKKKTRSWWKVQGLPAYESCTYLA